MLRVLVHLLDGSRRCTGRSTSSAATSSACRGRSARPTTSPTCSPRCCRSRSTWRCATGACACSGGCARRVLVLRAVRDAVARRARRRSPRSCCGRWRRGARGSAASSPGTVVVGRDAAAGVHALAAADRRAPRGQERGRAGQRRVARGVLVGRAADGRRPPDPRRRARGATAIESSNYILNDPINIDKPVVHNSYLEVLAEGGVPTLIAFIALIVGSWRLLARARDALPGRTRTATGCGSSPPRRRRWWSRSCRPTSSRCRSRSRCGCWPGSPRCCGSRPPRRGTREGRARHLDPVRRAGRARGAAGARPRARSGVVGVARWRADAGAGGALRRRRRARGGAAAAPPARLGAARCACTASCAARTWSTPTTAAAGCGCGSGRRTARCACTRCTGCRSRTSAGRPGLKGAAGLRRARAALAAAPTCSSRRRTPPRGCCAERVGYALDDIVVVPNGVDVPAAPLEPRRRSSGRCPRTSRSRAWTCSSRRSRACSRRRPGTRFVDLRDRLAGARAARAGARAAGRVPRPRARAREALRTLAVLALPSLHGDERARAAGGDGGGHAGGRDAASAGSRRPRRRARRRWSSPATRRALADGDPRPARRSRAEQIRAGRAAAAERHRGAHRRADARATRLR